MGEAKRDAQRNGYFIVFEGPDGSGKSTQAELLYNDLSRDGYPCIVTEEPGGTPEGKKIREILLDPSFRLCPKAELFLFLADRSEHVARVIEPALHDGMVVICSRYYYSTLVYQGIARRIADMDFLKQMNLFAVNFLEPDLVFYLDVVPEESLTKAMDTSSRTFHFHGGDRIEREGITFQRMVREGYLELSSQYGDMFVVIEQNDITRVHQSVYDLTKGRIHNDRAGKNRPR
jgi:dTMP kinase